MSSCCRVAIVVSARKQQHEQSHYHIKVHTHSVIRAKYFTHNDFASVVLPCCCVAVSARKNNKNNHTIIFKYALDVIRAKIEVRTRALHETSTAGHHHTITLLGRHPHKHAALPHT
jgi:hypothetical protein